VLAGAGCSGIAASESVSPATFLLPGLLKADPPPAHPGLFPPGNEPAGQLAQF